MALQDSPKKNRFLNSIELPVYGIIEKNLVFCKLARDTDIYHHASKIDYIYFPTNCIIALMNCLENGASPEVAAIGNDGFAGVEGLFGDLPVAHKYIVQSTGYAYKIKTEFIKELFESDAAFRDKLLKYNKLLFSQAAQLVVCNRYHTINQQICRFLLTSIDRWDSHKISLTHQRIADLLGVRRSSISEVSAKLAALGLITYHRGCVTILDKHGLQDNTCECYLVIKKEVKAMLNY